MLLINRSMNLWKICIFFFCSIDKLSHPSQNSSTGTFLQTQMLALCTVSRIREPHISLDDVSSRGPYRKYDTWRHIRPARRSPANIFIQPYSRFHTTRSKNGGSRIGDNGRQWCDKELAFSQIQIHRYNSPKFLNKKPKATIYTK